MSSRVRSYFSDRTILRRSESTSCTETRHRAATFWILPCRTYLTSSSRLTVAGSAPPRYFNMLDVGGTTKSSSAPRDVIKESAKPKDIDSRSSIVFRNTKGRTASVVSREEGGAALFVVPCRYR